MSVVVVDEGSAVAEETTTSVVALAELSKMSTAAVAAESAKSPEGAS